MCSQMGRNCTGSVLICIDVSEYWTCVLTVEVREYWTCVLTVDVQPDGADLHGVGDGLYWSKGVLDVRTNRGCEGVLDACTNRGCWFVLKSGHTGRVYKPWMLVCIEVRAYWTRVLTVDVGLYWSQGILDVCTNRGCWSVLKSGRTGRAY